MKIQSIHITNIHIQHMTRFEITIIYKVARKLIDVGRVLIVRLSSLARNNYVTIYLNVVYISLNEVYALFNKQKPTANKDIKVFVRNMRFVPSSSDLNQKMFWIARCEFVMQFDAIFNHYPVYKMFSKW